MSSKSVRFYSSINFIRFSMNTGQCPDPTDGKLRFPFIGSSRFVLRGAAILFDQRVAGVSCEATQPTNAKRSLVVGLDGLEPSTSRLSGARSNHLSYRPLTCWWSLVLIHLSNIRFQSLLKSGIRSLVSCFLWSGDWVRHCRWWR